MYLAYWTEVQCRPTVSHDLAVVEPAKKIAGISAIYRYIPQGQHFPAKLIHPSSQALSAAVFSARAEHSQTVQRIGDNRAGCRAMAPL